MPWAPNISSGTLEKRFSEERNYGRGKKDPQRDRPGSIYTSACDFKSSIQWTASGQGDSLPNREIVNEETHRAIADINEETAKRVAVEIAALGRRSLAARADVSSKPDWERMAEKVVEIFGRLDVLFCNAGIIQVTKESKIEQTTLLFG